MRRHIIGGKLTDGRKERWARDALAERVAAQDAKRAELPEPVGPAYIRTRLGVQPRLGGTADLSGIPQQATAHDLSPQAPERRETTVVEHSETRRTRVRRGAKLGCENRTQS